MFSTVEKLDFVSRAKQLGYFARLIARTQDGALRKVYETVPTWVDDAISELERHPDFVDLRVA